jgi:hypothetical protein
MTEGLEDNTYNAVIDLASIKRCWPVGHAVPQLITDIANLIAPWPNPAVGYVRFQGARFDDYWIELGGDLSEQFGKFIHLPDGTYIAMWFHDGAETGSEPVVEIGSEGELNMLAPNLKTFMRKWVDGKVHRELDVELLAEIEGPDYLLNWKTYTSKMTEVIDKFPEPKTAGPIANLPKFFAQWQSSALAKIAADPIMSAILNLMKLHIPKIPEGSDAETTYVFPQAYAVRFAGQRVEIQPPALPPDYTTFDPLPEREALIPLLLQARENRAKEFPGRGLWHDAQLKIHGDNYVLLNASWEFEPSFREGGRMTKAELDADLARFPRDPRWRQPWMDELL